MDPLQLAELDIENLAARFSENPQSPLFARLADLYLARQRVSEAVALCENGIALYPTYAGGHIVLGKCYQQLGRYSKARESYQRALELSPYNTVVHRLLVSLPETEQELGTYAVDVSDNALENDHFEVPGISQPIVQPLSVAEPDVPEEPVAPPVAEAAPIEPPAAVAAPVTPVEPPAAAAVPVMPEVPPVAAAVPVPPASMPPVTIPSEDEAPTFDPFPTFEQYIDLHPTTEPTMTLEEYLKGRTSSPLSEPATDFESLAKKLQNAKRIVPTDAPMPSLSPVNEPAPSMQAIVSPTMAEIYVSQNEFDAALSAYASLIQRQPSQAVLFMKRIEEIKQLQRTKQK